MSVGWSIAISALLASVGVVAAATLLLLAGTRTLSALTPRLVSFAVGTLLASTFLGLLPGALAGADAAQILPTTMAGILGFFLLEKLLIWRHCHQPGCEIHSASGTLILVGDGFHNFVDGVVIASAYLQSTALGVSATLAVVAHEAPQEAGDFGILLHSGYSRVRAVLFNLLSACSTILGAGVAYVAVRQAEQVVPFVLAVSAASFLYIGMADLIPNLHRDTRLARISHSH